MENLYYVGRPKGVLEYEYPSKFTRNSDSIQKKNYVFGSSVHLDAPDLVRHPLFQKARPIRTVLKPGEVLYLPAYWHHEVQSLPYHGLSNRYNSSLSKYDSDTSDRLRQAMDEQLGLNIAVNFWFQNLTYPVDDTKVLNL